MRHILFVHLTWSITVKDLEGVRSNPPFETKLFNFHRKFSETSEKLINNHVKLTKSNPFVNLNPLSRNPGSALIYFGGHRYDNFPNYCISFQDKQSDHRACLYRIFKF